MSYLIFGLKEWALRFPAFITGILLIPAIYIFGRIFFNKNVGLIAATFACISPALINYSILSSGFIFLIFFSVITFSIVRYLKDNYDPIVWLIFALLNSLGFITSPIFIYPFLANFIFLLLILAFRDTKLPLRNLRNYIFIYFCVALVMTFTLYMPLFTTAGLQNIININFSNFQSFKETITIFFYSLKSFWFISNIGIFNLFQILFVLLIFVGLITSLIYRLNTYRIKTTMFYQ